MAPGLELSGFCSANIIHKLIFVPMRLLLSFVITAVFLQAHIKVYSQEYTIEQYLSIRGAVAPQYSYDDSKIYFVSRSSGSSQVWYVNRPGSWQNQLTFFPERISSYSVNPKRDLILIEKDEGGSEYDQFFLLGNNGSEIEMITDNKPKVLYGFGRWADDGSFFTYYSNSRSPYYYDVYIYDVDKHSSEMIYSSDHSNYPSVISADGSKLVITRSYTTYDNDLYILDMKTREIKLVTQHDNYNEPAEFYSASFSADGSRLYYISNNKNEFYRLSEYSTAAGTVKNVSLPFTEKYSGMDISRAVFSGDRTKMLLLINDNGYDRLFMYDFKTGSEIKIPGELNSSSITAYRFSGNGEKVIIGINSSANPSVLYEWDLLSGMVLQVTFPVLAGIDPSGFVEPEIIKYKSFDGLEIPAFLYLPKKNIYAKHPCIVMIHGGPESQATYGFEPVFQYFLNAGYAVIEPNVRGSSGYGKKYAALDNVKNRENSVKDIASLTDYLKSRNDIDTDKLAVYGGSYGGYMVLACLTLYPDMFAAGIDVVGISNFVTFMQNTADYRRSNRESEYGSLEKDYDFLQKISPLNNVDNIKSPLMIIHGRNDPRVPVGEAEQMYNAIISRGGTAELNIYNDEGHGISKFKNRLDLYPKIINFLERYVLKK